MLHEHYPGERHYYDRLKKIMQAVDESPLVRRITIGELKSVRGRTGHYTVTFSPRKGTSKVFEGGDHRRSAARC
jgi:heterodisulfide reductase subunit A-like polyferredoxin